MSWKIAVRARLTDCALADARIADFSDHLPDDCEGKNVYFEWYEYVSLTDMREAYALCRRRWNTGAPIGRVRLPSLYTERANYSLDYGGTP